ncbi:DUF5062 family protein [Endozoicomonadaceae bacterium StTr2]
MPKTKKLRNEAALVKEALRIGAIYMEKRGGVGSFDDTHSANEKTRFLYRLLVNDRLIQPLAKGEETEPNMKHKLALWISRQLPDNHSLLRDC